MFLGKIDDFYLAQSFYKLWTCTSKKRWYVNIKMWSIWALRNLFIIIGGYEFSVAKQSSLLMINTAAGTCCTLHICLRRTEATPDDQSHFTPVIWVSKVQFNWLDRLRFVWRTYTTQFYLGSSSPECPDHQLKTLQVMKHTNMGHLPRQHPLEFTAYPWKQHSAVSQAVLRPASCCVHECCVWLNKHVTDCCFFLLTTLFQHTLCWWFLTQTHTHSQTVFSSPSWSEAPPALHLFSDRSADMSVCCVADWRWHWGIGTLMGGKCLYFHQVVHFTLYVTFFFFPFIKVSMDLCEWNFLETRLN